VERLVIWQAINKQIVTPNTNEIRVVWAASWRDFISRV
jgi:hypothetical protein